MLIEILLQNDNIVDDDKVNDNRW